MAACSTSARCCATARTLALLAVAYMIPVINYGDIITDEHCLRYGATLLGMMEEEFYDAVCRMADYAGATSHPSGTA